LSISGKLNEPGITQILFRFVVSSKEDTIRFFEEVSSGRFNLSTSFDPTQAGSYELDLFAGQLFESLPFLDDYGPINIVSGQPQLPPIGIIETSFTCPPTLQERSQVEIPLILGLAEVSNRVGFYQAAITWDPDLLEFDAVQTGSFGPLSHNLAQVDEGRIVLHAFGNAQTTTELARLQWRVIGTAGQSGSLSAEFEDLNANAEQDFRSLLSGLEAQACDFTITAAPIISGDIDLDGALTPRDALLALRLFLGTLTGATETQEQTADVDGDGQVTPRDALLILQAFLGRGSLADAGKAVDTTSRGADTLYLTGHFVQEAAGADRITLSIPGLPAGAIDVGLAYDPDQLEWLEWIPVTDSTNAVLTEIRADRLGFLHLVYIGVTAEHPELGSLRFRRLSGEADVAITVVHARFINSQGSSLAVDATSLLDG
jgi:hypothetical protein